MFRRVVLARGPVESSGYGENHAVLEALLGKAKVTGWTKALTVEGGPGSRGHAKRISRAAGEVGADLLHITSQEDAHLVPKKSSVPVVVSVHDLFDHRPRAIDAGDVPVPLGNRYPSSSRSKQIAACREGLARADLLLCASEMTMQDAREMFPKSKCVLLRDSVDDSFWDPIRNPRDRSLLGADGDESKCLLVSVGEKDPRWRGQFVGEIMAMVPEEVRADLHLLRIGQGKVDWEKVAAAFQHAEVMLYPGVSVGFRSPPLEAMASGCPVLASMLPLHNEVLPPRCLLPATDSDQWVSAIMDVHAEWSRSGGAPRHVDDDILEIAKSSFGRAAHGRLLSEAYDLVCSR